MTVDDAGGLSVGLPADVDARSRGDAPRARRLAGDRAPRRRRTPDRRLRRAQHERHVERDGALHRGVERGQRCRGAPPGRADRARPGERPGVPGVRPRASGTHDERRAGAVSRGARPARVVDRARRGGARCAVLRDGARRGCRPARHPPVQLHELGDRRVAGTAASVAGRHRHGARRDCTRSTAPKSAFPSSRRDRIA